MVEFKKGVMGYFLETPLDKIMIKDLVTADPDMILTEVCDIFENHSFHHIPVIESDGTCVGVISKSDYFQVQDRFTRWRSKFSKQNNEHLFKSLLASDIMTKEIVSLSRTSTALEAIDIFLKNKVHSIIVTDNGTCVGIVTPYDLLKQIKVSNVQMAS